MSRSMPLPEPVERLLIRRRRPMPPPRVDVATGPAAPAWVLRLAIVAMLAGGLALLTTNRGHWLVATVVLVGVAVRPDGVSPALAAGGLGLLLVTGHAPPSPARLMLLVLAIHLALELGATIGPVPVEAQIEWRILVRAAPTFLVVQAVAQTMALLGAWVAAAGPPPMPWLPLVAAVGLAILAWVVSWRLRDHA